MPSLLIFRETVLKVHYIIEHCGLSVTCLPQPVIIFALRSFTGVKAQGKSLAVG